MKLGICALIGSVRATAIAMAALGISSLAIDSASYALPPNVVIPGSGTQLTQVGDDFEDPNWGYVFNNPKSSEDIDEQQRMPLGKSNNGRWYEGVKRGHPDVVKRVPTPEGGLPGSEGAMLMQSLQTGIPSRPSRKMHQDDFIANVQYRVGGPISVAQTPNCTTRVFLPPIAEWEPRNGPHFAFRAAVETTINETKTTFLLPTKQQKEEIYWPGLFIVLETSNQSGKPEKYAHFRVRADRNGGDFKGPQIEVTGWWTLGMSFTPDGKVHYFAKPGIEDLTAEDYITSQYPYSYKCERFRTFFYNVINGDNGKTWSTPWIVDDPKVYVLQAGRLASNPKSNR